MRHSATLVAKLKSIDNVRCQDYAFLLNDYIYKIELLDNDEIHSLLNGGTIVDMSSELTLLEKRCVNTGWFKKLKANKKQSAILGSGRYGVVFRSVNIRGVFKDLSFTSIQERSQKIANEIKKAFRKHADFASKHAIGIVLEYVTSEASLI